MKVITKKSNVFKPFKLEISVESRVDARILIMLALRGDTNRDGEYPTATETDRHDIHVCAEQIIDCIKVAS